LQARATGDPGDLTNRAWAQSVSGVRVSNVATATVRIRPEHVFNCSDVIGKVFHDRNQNGVQDGVQGLILDDDVRSTGKYGISPEVEEFGEAGIPNARVVTPRGTIITTDEHGRFHVPCAALPGGRGENFTLKLDPRSLPSGFRIVTENPRTIRLTAGKMARLNFGVALSRVIDIDLTGTAFQTGTSAPSADLIAALDGLLPVLEDAPSTIRLSYLDQGEGDRAAWARMRAVEVYLRDRWSAAQPYALVIERSVITLGGAGQ